MWVNYATPCWLRNTAISSKQEADCCMSDCRQVFLMSTTMRVKLSLSLIHFMPGRAACGSILPTDRCQTSMPASHGGEGKYTPDCRSCISINHHFMLSVTPFPPSICRQTLCDRSYPVPIFLWPDAISG